MPTEGIYAWYCYGQDNGTVGARIFFTNRLGPSSWSTPVIYVSDSDVSITDPTHAGQLKSGFTAGIEGKAPLSNPNGVVTYGDKLGATGWPSSLARPWYVGQGAGAACYPITIDNLDLSVYRIDILDYWDMSGGVWKINGHGYCMFQYNNHSIDNQWWLCMLKATTFDSSGIPTQWTACDHGNDPKMQNNDNRSAAVRWDGLSNTVDVFTAIAGSDTNYGFYRFDTTTNTWGSPFGVHDFGRNIFMAGFHGNGNHGESVYRYSNGDMGIVYSELSPPGTKTFYRLWSSASSTWGSEITIKDYASSSYYPYIQQVLPEGDRLHVFDVQQIATGGVPALNYAGRHHIVDHDGTLHVDRFIFPTLITTTGFEHGAIYNGNIFIPWTDGYSLTGDVAIWVGDVDGTSFNPEALIRPGTEPDRPANAYVIAYLPGEGGGGGPSPPTFRPSRKYLWTC